MSVKQLWGTIGRKLSAFKKACIKTCTPDGPQANVKSPPVAEPPSRYESEQDPPPAMAETPKSGAHAREAQAIGFAAEREEHSAEDVPPRHEQPPAEPTEHENDDQAEDHRQEEDYGQADEHSLSVRSREDELAARPVIDPDDLRELMDALRTLPESMSSLSTALREQLALPGQIAQALEKFRESGMEEEILESMRDLATEAKNQTDCLQGIQQSMHTTEQTQQKVIQSLAQLNEATETNNKATAAQAELMEQVRDHLSSANLELREQVEEHTSQLKKFGMIGAIILVLGMAAMIAAILMK